MTRKRVGQGLIEAFSTTCESCGGRGIHVHMEPVNKKSLDREITPTHDQAQDHAADHLEESEPEAVSEEAAEESQDSEEKPRFGRKRRRAASSGVVTA
jgi:ribonuclease E